MAISGPARLGPGLESSLWSGSGLRRRSDRLGQVDHEDVDGSPDKERSGHRDPLLRRSRLEDNEPLQANAPGHGLDRVQASGKVHPGSNRTRSLGLGDKPQGEGGPAARRIAAQGDRRIAGHPTRPEDCIERSEAGPDHPVRIDRLRQAARERLDLQLRGDRERTDHPRSCRSPARPEGCKSG